MATAEDLRRAGATIVDPATVEGLQAINRPREAGACGGFKYDMNRYLAARGDLLPVKNLAEISLRAILRAALRLLQTPFHGRPGRHGVSGEGS